MTQRKKKLKSPCVVAIGVFDGVHKGHQILLNRLLQLSNNYPAVLLTFHPHPQEIVRRETMPLLTLPEERKQLLRALDIKKVVTLPFNEKLRRTSPETFVKTILVEQLNAKRIIVGYDFMFGKGREGTAGFLTHYGKRYGLEVYIEPPVRRNGVAISSSLIRRYIQAGKVAPAASLLGRYYALSGKVQPGKGRGKKIGFPTYNLSFSKKKCCPAYGVYAVIAQVARKSLPSPQAYPAVCNFGFRPTFEKLSSPLLEVHFLEDPGSLRPRQMTVQFVSRIRQEKEFKNSEQLTARIAIDKEQARKRLKKVCKLT